MPAAIFARLALIEARRGGLAWLVGLSIVGAVAIGGVLAHPALTQSRPLQAAGVGAPPRFFSLFALCAVDAVALLLPALDRVTRTEWLLYATPDMRSYALALGGMLIYAALIAAAGVFDFERRA